MRRLSAGQIRSMRVRLACLLTWSGSGMSGGPMARGVHGVSAWCSRRVHVVHVVADQEHVVADQEHVAADQEHSDCAVPRYHYGTELVWRFVMPTAHARTVGQYLSSRIP